MTASTRAAGSPMVRYGLAGAAFYVASTLVAITLPAVLGIPGNGLMVAGGGAILLSLLVVPALLVARAGTGVAPAALVAAASVLVGQAVVVGLASIGVPGLLQWDHAPREVVAEALMEAVTLALFALFPAAAAAVCASAALRVHRARRLRSSPG